jgi:hypothetical protein
MKQIIKKYLGWLKDSNRPKHMKAGMLVFIAMLAVCLTLGVGLSPSTVIAFVATVIVAVAVDYKDKLYGNTFDWLDVLATVLLPGVTTLIILILNCIL